MVRKMHKFFKWCRENKNKEKFEMTLKCDEAIKTWISSVMNLKQHSASRCSIWTSLKRTWKILLYFILISVKAKKNAKQDKIQRAYFGQSSFSIFTACAYTKNGEIRTIPVTVTTESNEHSCVTALSCIHKIISHIEEKVWVFTKFYIWSDGLASQFRSRFIFSFLSIFHLEKETE